MRMPKVLMLVENIQVPGDPRVWAEATALRDAGMQISIICPKGQTQQASLGDQTFIINGVLTTNQVFAYFDEQAKKAAPTPSSLVLPPVQRELSPPHEENALSYQADIGNARLLAQNDGNGGQARRYRDAQTHFEESSRAKQILEMKVAPEEMPQKRPSFAASARAVCTASASVTGTIRWGTSRLRTAGMKSGVQPWIL